MLSPDDASDLADLRDVVRTVMRDTAHELDRPLDWMAVDHANTGRLHAHVVLRGRDREGRPIDLDARRLHRRIRARAMAVLMRELGPDTDRALRERLRAEARSQRLTGLDLGLAEQAVAGVIDLRSRPDDRHTRFARARQLDRARTLARMGLAVETAPLQWRLEAHALGTLRAMGTRRDTYRLLEQTLEQAGLDRPLRDRAVAGARILERGITGALVMQGLRTGARATPYVVVDGVDGRVWYADVAELPRDAGRGAVVALRAAHPGLAALDRTIASETAVHHGVWRMGRPGRAREDRRVRSLARSGIARPVRHDQWTCGADLEARIRDAGLARLYREARVAVLDPRSLDRQVAERSLGWLDSLGQDDAPTIANRGFGRAVRAAFARRKQRRIAQGLAVAPHGRDRITNRADTFGEDLGLQRNAGDFRTRNALRRGGFRHREQANGLDRDR